MLTSQSHAQRRARIFLEMVRCVFVEIFESRRDDPGIDPAYYALPGVDLLPQAALWAAEQEGRMMDPVLAAQDFHQELLKAGWRDIPSWARFGRNDLPLRHEALSASEKVIWISSVMMEIEAMHRGLGVDAKSLGYNKLEEVLAGGVRVDASLEEICRHGYEAVDAMKP